MKVAYRSQKFRLRPVKRRYQLMRTMCTQLIEHERIVTTFAKAYHMRPTAERLINYAMQGVNNNDPVILDKALFFVRTDLVKNKLIEEIVPRFNKKEHNYLTRVKKLRRRRGDNAQLAYIELFGNPIQLYELQEKQDKIDSGEKIDMVSYELTLLQQEIVFLNQEKDDIVNQVKDINEQMKEIKSDSQTFKQLEKKLVDLDEKEYHIEKQIRVAEKDIRINQGDHSELELLEYQIIINNI